LRRLTAWPASPARQRHDCVAVPRRDIRCRLIDMGGVVVREERAIPDAADSLGHRRR